MMSDTWLDDLWSLGPVEYGQTKRADLGLVGIKGRQTKKFFHVSVYRMDSGRYELTTYIL